MSHSCEESFAQYPRCPNCAREWHGLPISMYTTILAGDQQGERRFTGCAGSFIPS